MNTEILCVIKCYKNVVEQVLDDGDKNPKNYEVTARRIYETNTGN